MLNTFKSKRALTVYGIGVLAITVICTLLRLFSIMFFFDVDIGYYSNGAALPIILNIILFAATAAMLVFCFIRPLKLKPSAPTATKSVKLSAVLPAVGFALYAIIYFKWMTEYLSVYGTLSFSHIITFVSTVLACIFFCLFAFRKNNGDIIYILTGIFAVVWLVLALSECYFDTLVQMNSPNKLIFQFSVLGAMLLTVNELRQWLDFKRPNFHLFSASAAAIFTLTSSVPSIICYFTDSMPKSYTLLYSDTVLLCIGIFAAVRLINLCFKVNEIADASDCENTVLDVMPDNDTDENAKDVNID